MRSSFRRSLLRTAFVLAALAILGGCGQDVATPASTTANAERAVDGTPTAIASDPANARPKRIILISLDTVGARNVGGYSDAKTPNIDKIARDGVRFDRFYSASTYTLPSHMSMLTGLDVIEHGVVNMPSQLAPDVPTLASELAEAGYTTKAIVEGGFVHKSFGFDRGFSEFDTLKKKRDLVKTSIWTALDWMREQEERPYFLFLHTYAAHAPYGGFHDFRNQHPELDLPSDEEIVELKRKFNGAEHLPAPRDIPVELRFMCTFYNLNAPAQGDWVGCGDQGFKDDFRTSEHFDTYRLGLIDAHREGIRIGDRMVGQVRDTLIELGQLDDTLLVVTSDHGEGMFEHDVHGHGYLPFEEIVRVPLILSYPRKIPGGQVVPGLTWHLDLFPTILSLAQRPYSSDLLGQDLSGVVMRGESVSQDRMIHPVLLRPTNRTPLPMRRMAIQGDHKFIEGHPLYGDPDGLLFDLKNAPGEDDNLREAMPDRFAQLQESALDYDASLTPGEPVHRETGERISPFPGEVEPFELPDDVRKNLAELGYIIGEKPSPEATPKAPQRSDVHE